MKKYIVFVLLLTIIIPSVAFASWWNPFTWKIFHKTQIVPQVQIETQKTSDEKINDLQKEIDSLKKQQTTPTSTSTTPVVKKEVKKIIPIVANPVITKPEITQPQVQTQITSPVEKNYSSEAKLRVKTLIGMENSFKTWLQDTSDQFRSAVLTLSGYSSGGLAGEIKEATIKLANAEISVISSLIIKSNTNIAKLERVQDIINNNSFTSEATFNIILNPENYEKEIETVKQDINKSLNSVLNSLQIH